MGVETTLRTPNRPATPAMTDDSPLTFCLPAVSRKKVTAAFDGGRLSSDSGVILLSLAGRRRAIARTLAALIDDPRDPAHITHTVADVLSARMLAIACGYPDGNDFHFLRSDPAFKLACGRLPDTGADLCIYRDEQKSVKYVSASRVNACAQPEQLRRRRRRWRPVWYFYRDYQGLERAGALVNLPARQFRRRSFRSRNVGVSVRDGLTNRCRHSQFVYKNIWSPVSD